MENLDCGAQPQASVKKMGYQARLLESLLSQLSAERRGWFEQIDESTQTPAQIYNSAVQMGVAPLMQECVFCNDARDPSCKPHSPPDPVYNRAFWHLLKSKKLLAPLRVELLKDSVGAARAAAGYPREGYQQVASGDYADQLLTYYIEYPRGWWDTTCTLWVFNTEKNLYEDIVETACWVTLAKYAAIYLRNPTFKLSIHRGKANLGTEQPEHHPVSSAVPKGSRLPRPCALIDGEYVDLHQYVLW